MIVFIILAMVMAVLGAIGRPACCSRRVEGLLPRETTACVNGLFIIFVFASHGMQYVPKSALSSLDYFYIATARRLGQLIVTTFLLYSGYGIMESIASKKDYAARLPLCRIAPFVLDVSIALVPFALIRLANGNMPTLNDLLLAVVGRTSLGNSNWYIFAILCMWLATWIAFRLTKSPQKGAALAFLLTVVYALVLWIDDPEATRWYNTIFCYPAGMALSLYLKAHGGDLDMRRRLLLLCVCLAAFATSYVIREPYAVMYNVRSIAFALLVTLVVIKSRWVSAPLVWAGENLFYLYIYQRLFMILFRPLVAWGTIPFMACVVAALVPWCMFAARAHRKARGLFCTDSVASDEQVPVGAKVP